MPKKKYLLRLYLKCVVGIIIGIPLAWFIFLTLIYTLIGFLCFILPFITTGEFGKFDFFYIDDNLLHFLLKEILNWREPSAGDSFYLTSTLILLRFSILSPILALITYRRFWKNTKKTLCPSCNRVKAKIKIKDQILKEYTAKESFPIFTSSDTISGTTSNGKSFSGTVHRSPNVGKRIVRKAEYCTHFKCKFCGYEWKSGVLTRNIDYTNTGSV